MRPSLRQLEYAVAVARLGSFSKAAAECRVSQPGLSTQIQRLEQILGTQLFERRPREVIVTHAGAQIVSAARTVLHDVDHLVSVADASQDLLSGTVRLGVIPTIAPYLLPPAMSTIRRHYPELRLLLQEDQTHRLVDMVENGTLDLAVVALESDLGKLESRALFHDPFVLAVSRSHHLAGRKRVKPADVEGEDVLLLADGHCLRDQTSIICDSAGACELGDFRATSLGTLIQMVASGVGITLLPKLAVDTTDGLAAQLALIPFVRPAPGRTIALAFRGSSPHRRRIELFARSLIPADARPIETSG